MAKYKIEGGKRLFGKVKISGNKNSILPALAAATLTDEEVILRNAPQILDVDVFLEILRSLGVKVKVEDDVIKINSSGINSSSVPSKQSTYLRASILLVGPLLSRFGKVNFFYPGGDVVGRRSIETHLLGFEKLGYHFKVRDRNYKGFLVVGRDEVTRIFLDEASVTATENMILGSVVGRGEVIIRNCAQEPHVVDLCRLLSSMGARIEGAGTQTLKIRGVDRLAGADFTIGPDHIEFGTYAIAAALTSGKVVVECENSADLEPIVCPLKKIGLNFSESESGFLVSAKNLTAVPKLVTNIWPGFPTDLMSVAIVLCTQAKGVSLLHDWFYESRMFFVDKLISMGANITIADPHRVLVYGPSSLYGRNLETPDIRAGMALVLAALAAQGTSTINRAELIERGYEKVIEKLSALGANIERVS